MSWLTNLFRTPEPAHSNGCRTDQFSPSPREQRLEQLEEQVTQAMQRVDQSARDNEEAVESRSRRSRSLTRRNLVLEREVQRALEGMERRYPWQSPTS